MKYKVLIILIGLVALLLGTGITYSIFSSSSNLTLANQQIAKFIFETEKLDHLELSLDNITPGKEEEYLFSISNALDKTVSNVTINYQITIETFHFMPLDIALYKVKGETEELIMQCDETYSRNTSNILVCNSAMQEMSYEQGVLDNYKLKVSFPADYDSEDYADLVDFLDLKINSWQKMSE